MERVAADAPKTQGDASGDSGLRVDGFTEFLGRVGHGGGRDLGPGTRLGDVTIVRLVGEGGMGRVYEALQGMPCRTVAVKIVRPGVFSEAAAKRFQHEVHILGRLTHPGICRIYSVGLHQQADGDVPFFVMEFIDEALSITSYASQRDLSVRDRVQLLRDACGAVAHGHQKGVIHRDLKPGNILVDAAGRPKIIDFGVARSTDGDVALTTMHTDVGQLVGTLAYMAPEQFDGNADDLDVRADVYSLGLVLYELLTGRMPYDVTRQAVYEVARIVRDVEPRSLSSVNPKLRRDLNTIVAKCLEKDRSHRYSSASELEADLGRYLRGEPIAASRPSLIESIVRLARRHRLAATAAVGVAASLLLAVAGISLFAVRAERQREVAVDAQQSAMRDAKTAAEQRDAADRERARADSEAALARERLYVANLRSIQSSLDAKNLRMAKKLSDENAVLQQGTLPIEMRCMTATMDDAFVVLDPAAGPISQIKYSPDAAILSVSVMVPVDPRKYVNPLRPPRESAGFMWRVPLFYSAGDDGRYQRLDPTIVRARGFPDVMPLPMSQAIARGAKQVSYSHVDESGAIAISPDGRLIAVPTPSNGIRIVDRATGEDEVVLDGLRGRPLTTLAFNTSGTRLVTQIANGMPDLWDTATGRLITRCGDGDRICERYELSPDGSRLAVVTVAPDALLTVRILDTVDGRRLSTVTVAPKHQWGELIIAFTKDGNRLLTSCQDNDLSVWNVADGGLLTALRGHASLVTSAVVSADGRKIANGAANGHIRIWNADTHALEQELIGHTAAVTSLQFRDGQTLASGSHDGTVRIWSITGISSMAELPDIRGVTAAVFSPDGRHLAVAAGDRGGVQIWCRRKVRRIHTLIDSNDTVSDLAYSPDGSLVAAAFQGTGQAGVVRVWQTECGTPVSTLADHGGGAVAVEFSPDGSRLLTTARDGTVAVSDARAGRRLMAHRPEFRIVSAKTPAVFGLDGRRVISVSPEVLDSDTGAVAAKVQRQGVVSCLAASPDGRTLATGVAMGFVFLTDFSTGERLSKFVGHQSDVRSLAFDADGHRLLVGTLDGTIRLWDARQRGLLDDAILVLRGHEGAVDSIGFSPDGSRIISGSLDGTIRIWDAMHGHELLVLPGQRDFPKAFALSPDGTHLLSATVDGRIRIWGLSNAEIFRARQAAADGDEMATSPRKGDVDGVRDVGQHRRPHESSRLLKGAEKGGQVGQILPVETEGLEER